MSEVCVYRPAPARWPALISKGMTEVAPMRGAPAKIASPNCASAYGPDMPAVAVKANSVGNWVCIARWVATAT